MERFRFLGEKLYYSIGEVAKAFQVKPSLLRFWEKQFPVLIPKKTRTGIRKYTPEDLVLLEQIYTFIKVRGFTIAGAKREIAKLALRQKQLDEVIEEVVEIKKRLAEVIEGLEGGDVS